MYVLMLLFFSIVQAMLVHIDVPRPLTNDHWVFLFQTIDAQCVKRASPAGTCVCQSFYSKFKFMPETFFSTTTYQYFK